MLQSQVAKRTSQYWINYTGETGNLMKVTSKFNRHDPSHPNQRKQLMSKIKIFHIWRLQRSTSPYPACPWSVHLPAVVAPQRAGGRLLTRLAQSSMQINGLNIRQPTSILSHARLRITANQLLSIFCRRCATTEGLSPKLLTHSENCYLHRFTAVFPTVYVSHK